MPRRRRKILKLKVKTDVILSIIAILLISISLLITVALFNGGGSLNFVIREVILELFGKTAFFVPPILFYTGLLFIRSLRLKLLQIRILLGFVVFYISLAGIMNEGAGLVGSTLFGELANRFGTLSPKIIYSALIIASVLFIFDISMDTILKTFSKLFSFNPSFLKPALSIFKRDEKEKPRTYKTSGLEEEDGEEEEEKNIESEKKSAKKKELEVVPNISEPIIKGVESATNTVYKTKGSEKETPATTNKNKPLYPDRVWDYPPTELLSDIPPTPADRGNVKERAQIIEKTLDSFGIKARVVEINMGPAVTQYALETSKGTKIARITNLSNDLALALASPNGMVRIEAPIPGKSLIGIEVPNFSPSLVTLKNVLNSDVVKNAKSKLSVALGLDVAGRPFIADVGKMPHVLIAGSTGSGKSVLLNSFISTLMFRCSPMECRLILIDPKRVEFANWQNIPHLLTKVIVEAEKAVPALKWAVMEMERRYKLFESAKVRNIDAFNEMSGFQALPYIVIIVDELAELMSLSKTDVEKSICRLAQKSRATGIHLILATQRPSVDVLTGLIKANIPCRISFNVTSQIDSRVIIDMVGAEKLLGKGDMLFVPPDASKPIRIQGTYVSDSEIERLVSFLRNSGFETEYLEDITSKETQVKQTGTETAVDDADEALFREAVEVAVTYGKASTSLLQRKLSIGYSKAARLLDEMEERKIVSPQVGSKPREILINDTEDISGV